MGLEIGPKLGNTLSTKAGTEVKRRIEDLTDAFPYQFDRLSIKELKKGKKIIETQQGLDPDLTLSSVQMFSNSISKVLVQMELEKANVH